MMACGDGAQNLSTYRLTPGLLLNDATHLYEPSDYLSGIYWRVSKPRESHARVCAKGSPGSMFGALYSLVLLATFRIYLYEHENMSAACCDALRCTHYTRVAAPARHAMRSMSECTCMPETDRVYHADTI